MTDTSRRRVLNNAFQVLKPPCLQREASHVQLALRPAALLQLLLVLRR
jgi:hypothetical protein